MESPTKYDFKWYKDDFDTNPTTRGRLFANRSLMEDKRSKWVPPVPSIFSSSSIQTVFLPQSECMSINPEVLEKWPEFSGMVSPVMLESFDGASLPTPPSVVGIILAGEWVPSSGTHNVIVGFVRESFSRNPNIRILGFLGGPQGFARRHYIDLTSANVSKYLNQGGADMLGFGSLRAMQVSDYIEIETLFLEYKLNGLIFIGGPNELSHMSQLIQFSRQRQEIHPTIIGIFQSPNGNVYVPNGWVPVTLGYDSTRTALAEYVGNIAMDGLSSGRQCDVSFIRCGSTTVTIEVALQVCPAITILAEEVAAKKLTLDLIIEDISRVISHRLANKSPTTVLISEKFYACLEGFQSLQRECQELYRTKPTLVVPIDGVTVDPRLLIELTSESRELLARFPVTDQVRIVRAYDSNGCPTWPETEPEKLFAKLVGSRFSKLNFRTHCIGLEARCPFPSNFDCSLGLALGMTAAHLVANPACHGYVAAVKGLGKMHSSDWQCGGFPLASILQPPVFETAGPRLLTDQFGGANQELINLARQRVEKESLVPRIALRPENIFTDSLFKYFQQQRTDFEILPVPKQPGPYQFDQSEISFAALVDESVCEVVVNQNFPKNRTCDRDFISANQGVRLEYFPDLPKCLQTPHIVDCPVTPHRSDPDLVLNAFPNTASTVGVYFDSVCPSVQLIGQKIRIGVVFLGRHVPGCHNIVWGLLGSNRVFGFKRGILGLMNGDFIEVTESVMESYRNQSGIDLLGRSENPFRSKDEMSACVATCKKLKLDGLIVVGGIGTHADTAILAELMVASNIPTRVIGIPASIENDIPLIEKSVGHDTACRVYGSLIGSLSTLAASSKRQWCFVRISGRSGLSQVVAQASLYTHPNLILLSEEIIANRMSLADIVNVIGDLISERAKNGHDFGVVVFSETILERVEEVVCFSNEIFDLQKLYPEDWQSRLAGDLSPMSAALYEALPMRARAHIHHYNGSHEIRLIDPEVLIESLVGKELQRRKIFSVVKGSFVSTTHALSGQARSSIPSNLDCDLAFAMGAAAAHLVRANRSGLLVHVKGTESAAVADWQVEAVPITSILTVTKRPSEYRIEIERKEFPVSTFRTLLPPPSIRRFVNPGPLQFDNLTTMGSDKTSNAASSDLAEIANLCSHIMSLSASATDEKIRRVIGSGLKYALEILRPEGGNELHPVIAELRSSSVTCRLNPSLMRRIGSDGRIVRVFEHS